MAVNLPSTSAVGGPGKYKEKPAFTRTILGRMTTDVEKYKQNVSLCSKSENPGTVPDNPHVRHGQKFQIFEDKASRSEVVSDENSNSTHSTTSCSSPGYIDDTPKEKEPFFSYGKTKKEKIRSHLSCAPYTEDIEEHLRVLEVTHKFNYNYMDRQPEITDHMRSILVDWFIEVGEEYKMQTETLHLAVSYVDRFLSRMSVLRGKLQLVGVACMLLASKFEEVDPPELKEFVYITDNAYTKDQVLSMEHLVLRMLNFDLSLPTVYAFQQLYCSAINASETVIYLSQYICELTLVHGDPFLKFRPSLIAAGSIALTNYTLGCKMWDERHSRSIGYELERLIQVICCLYQTYINVPRSSFQAAYVKYKKVKFGCVANIRLPYKLLFPDMFNRPEMKKKLRV